MAELNCGMQKYVPFSCQKRAKGRKGGDYMKEIQVVQNGRSEREILSATLPGTTADDILRGMKDRAEYCVVHLCGCE